MLFNILLTFSLHRGRTIWTRFRNIFPCFWNDFVLFWWHGCLPNYSSRHGGPLKISQNCRNCYDW